MQGWKITQNFHTSRRMKLSYLVYLPIILYLFPTCQGSNCLRENKLSGVISDSIHSSYEYSQCWTIEVPEDTYVQLIITRMNLSSVSYCSTTFVKITLNDTKETYTYCSGDTEGWKSLTAINDVSIQFSHDVANTLFSTFSSFQLSYHIEDLICAEKNNFRCSNHSCIHEFKVCDGVTDCENGMDETGCEKGILAVKGISASRDSTLTWLKNQRSPSAGWGKDTHRAITALYLANTSSFRGQNLEEELMVKELELQALVALMRNSTNYLTVSELSMHVNALAVTCHNVRRFYGYDLLQILAEQVANPESSSPGAYLTLCNSNWTLTESDTRRLLKLLQKYSKYPFHFDGQAMAVMALTCIKNQTEEFANIPWAFKAYNEAIEKFVAGQLSDGSFGNVYTTALVTQALIGSGQENNKQWNVTSTVQYLMKQLSTSSEDFLSAYLALPVFSGKSLVDIKSVNCGNSSRKQDEDNEISQDKFSGKTLIQYSLYVGDEKDIIHTMYLRMPVNSSAYDVMQVAQVADPKYKFVHRDVSDHMYVYRIADITNDPEAGKFWLMYTGYNYLDRTVKPHTESPDKFILEDEGHLIMWYQTAQI